MKKIVYALISILLVSSLVWAAGALQTINPLPSSTTTFLTDLQTFLRNEDAQRFQYIFRSFVVSGGTHSTGSGLLHTPTTLVAFPNGYFTTETGSITYPNNDVCYVIADPNLTGNLTTFTRVTGTHYLMDCVSASPATPSSAVALMTVTTSGGAVTVVSDTRVLTAIATTQSLLPYAVGDLVYANTTTTLAKLADIATGNALLSGGTNTAPLYGKIGLTTHISGTLPCANGGTSVTGAPTNGQLLLGNGTCFTIASLTAGSGITITPGAGALTISSATSQIGLWSSRGLSAFNNSGTPNTQFDLTANAITFMNPSTGAAALAISPASVTVNISTAGPIINGRDQAGAFSVSSWVYFYWIRNDSSGVVSGIASASAPMTGPAFPASHTSWVYAGAVRIDASGNLVRTRIRGNTANYEAGRNAVTDGSATTETTVSLTSLIPPSAQSFEASMRQANVNAATMSLTLRYISGSDFVIFGPSTTVNQHSMNATFKMPNISQQFFYIWGAVPVDGATIDILGYTLPNGAS